MPEERQAWAADVAFALSTIDQPPHRLGEPREPALIRILAKTARRYTGRPLDPEAAAVFAEVTGQRGITPSTYQRRRARLERM